MDDLSGKVVIISRVSTERGKETAIHYAKLGATLALLDSNVDEQESLKQEIEAIGSMAIALTCDVDSEHDVKNAIHSVEEILGHVDIVLLLR